MQRVTGGRNGEAAETRKSSPRKQEEMGNYDQGMWKVVRSQRRCEELRKQK